MAALPVAPIAALPEIQGAILPPPQLQSSPGTSGFANILAQGIEGVNADLLKADRLVHDFALNDAIPVHQVTYALEQSRLSLNLMMQIRNRLVEAYQQMMNMQL